MLQNGLERILGSALEGACVRRTRWQQAPARLAASLEIDVHIIETINICTLSLITIRQSRITTVLTPRAGVNFSAYQDRRSWKG